MKTSILLLLCFVGMLQSIYAQDNDDCRDALLLETGRQCTPRTYSNIDAGAEEDAVAQDPSCGSYVGGDVWFKLGMPSSGALRVEVDNLQGATPPSFILYSGSCGAFEEVACVRNDKAQTVYQPTLAGDTLYIRVYSFFSTEGMEFSLCAYEPEIPQNDLCANALVLEVKQSCQSDVFSNAFATAQPDTLVAGPSCGYYQGGDVWFTTVMPAAGVLRISKNRISGATHPAMSIYTGNCGSFTEAFCSENDPTETFTDSSLAGKILYLRVFSFNDEEGADFSLCLYEEEAPENDDCEQAIPILVESSCSTTYFSNLLATAESSATAPTPSCGAYQGEDVWFRTEMPASGILQIETERLSGPAFPSITIYSGSCGEFEEVACISNTEVHTLVEPGLAGQSLYLRVFTYNSEDGEPFSLCIFEPSCMPDTVDAGQMTLCQGESFSFGSQTLTQAGEYTEAFQNSNGCDSLVTLSIIVNTVDTVVRQDGHTLTAQAESTMYQWINCADGNFPIDGATGQSFTATTAGDYAVIVMQNACMDTSACFTIHTVSLADEERVALMIFPNPVNQWLNVELPHPYENVWMEFMNMKGQTIKTAHLQGKSKTVLDMYLLPSGIYIIKIYSGKGFSMMKLIKE